RTPSRIFYKSPNLLQIVSENVVGKQCLAFEQEGGWVFDQVFDPHQEWDGLAAVDDAVVVGQGQVHHGSNHDLTVDGDWSLQDAVHAQDANLRQAQDGRRQQRAVDAAVGNGERAAAQVFKRERVRAGF